MSRKATDRTKSETAAFGKRLRKLRESRGWSQNQLADKAGITQAMLSQLESSAKQPGWETVQALADAMEIATDEFR